MVVAVSVTFIVQQLRLLCVAGSQKDVIIIMLR